MTWEANESCRVWNKEKELKQKLRQDSRRQGPVWQVRRRNEERRKLKRAAEKRRAERRSRRRKRRKATAYLRKLRGRNADISATDLDNRFRRLAREEMDNNPTMRRRALFTSDPGFMGTLGIEISNDTLQLLLATRTRLEGKDRVTLYSDGSMRNASNPDASMAFGIVVDDGGELFPLVSTGRVAEFASSTKAELAGQLAAIIASPRNVSTTIYIDNSVVVSQFQTMVRRREDCIEK